MCDKHEIMVYENGDEYYLTMQLTKLNETLMELDHINQITYLELDECELHYLPPQIYQMSGLRELSFANNKITTIKMFKCD